MDQRLRGMVTHGQNEVSHDPVVTVRKRSGRPRLDPAQRPDPTTEDPNGKLCPRCSRTLTIESFSRNERFNDGRCFYCRRCMRDYLDVHRAEQRAYSRDYNRQLRIAALEHYGKWCKCCGEAHEEFLAIDHEHRTGDDRRRLIGSTGGVNMYLWLKRNGYPAGFRTLCHNCNLAIGFYGYCPHRSGVLPRPTS